MSNKGKNKRIIELIKNELIFHIIFLVVMFLINLGSNPFDPESIKSAALFILHVFPMTYIHYYLMERFLLEKRYLIYFLSFAVSLTIFAYIDYYAYAGDSIKKYTLFASFFKLFFTIGLFTSLLMIKRGIKSEFIYREIKEKHARTELALLKSQINPHFLFNTLNNLFSLARKQKAMETSDGIAKLSGIMRYMIYDSNVEFLELQKEIDQIQNYIELQKLRISEEDPINISFSTDGNTNELKIAPMLLVPFVENAFKHSITFQKSTYIDIDLKAADGNLEFSVKNTINKLKKDNDKNYSGFGLDNIKKRLDLLYPEKYKLTISEDEDLFKVYLKINLKVK